MPQTFDMLTFGSITLDIFIPLNKDMPIEITGEKNKFLQIPLGEKIQVKSSLIQCGGGAANSAVGFSKLELKTAAFGVLGDQSYKKFILDSLEKYNINTSFLTIAKNQPSSFSVILNSWDGKRTVMHHRTVCDDFSGEVLLQAPKTKGVYIGHLYASGFLRKVDEWKHKNKSSKIFWNPGKTQFKKGFEYFKNMYAHIDCIFINKEEAEMFTGLKSKVYRSSEFETFDEKLFGKKVTGYTPYESPYIADVRNLADKFLEAGIRQVVITDGPSGAQAFTKKEHRLAQSQAVEVVDTLGAGDAFAIGVSAAILKGEDIETQLKWGSFNSGSVIQKLGAQPGQLTLGEINLLAQ